MNLEDLAARLDQIDDRLKTLAAPAPPSPFTRHKHNAGDLVQIHGYSNHAYAGLPALVLSGRADYYQCTILTPHRGGAAFNFSSHDLVHLADWPTPEHKWIRESLASTWWEDLTGWKHVPDWHQQTKRAQMLETRLAELERRERDRRKVKE